MTAEKVIVTGASGYIAAHVVDQFLKAGYSVVGTVRSQAKGQYLADLFRAYGDKFSWALVPDMQVEGCYDEAVKGCQGFIHVASPFFTENVTDPYGQLVNPAIKGTRNALLACKAAGCRRFVVTSSVAAIGRISQKLPYTYTEDDWNTESTPEMGPGPAYQASKVRAERSVWDFARDEKPGFDAVSLNPPLVIGPVIHETSLSSLNTSMNIIFRCVSGMFKQPLPGGFGYIHVQDLARAHVLAFSTPAASGQRYIIAEGTHSGQELCDLLRSLYPSLHDKVPEGTPGAYPVILSLDNGKSKRELGMEYVPFEEMLRESVDQLLEMGGKEGAKV